MVPPGLLLPTFRLDRLTGPAYTELMRRSLGLLASFLIALPAAAADVSVRLTDGRVDLSATAAPIADVLERLSKQTGMKVVYEGPAPRQLVTVSLHGRSPTEAVLGLLEGQGLNYILIGDASGERVQTLMMAGATAMPSKPSLPASPNRPGPRASPPASRPDPDEAVEDPEQEEEPEPAQAVQPPNGLPQLIPGAGPNGGVPAIAGQPTTPNPPPAVSIPGLGLPGFSGALPGPTPFGLPTVQPFLPQPAPMQPATPTPAPPAAEETRPAP